MIQLCWSCGKRPRYKGKGRCYPCKKAAQGSQVYSDFLSYDKAIEFDELILLGFWVGDGNWKNNRTPEVCVTQRNAAGLKKVIEDIPIRYGLYLDGRGYRTEPLWRFNLYSQYGLRMIDLGFDTNWRGAEKKQLPETILSKENALGLLTGLWMSDGSFGGTRPQYTTTSGVLDEQVSRLLRACGFDSGTTKSRLPSGKTEHNLYLRGENWRDLQKVLRTWGSKHGPR